MKFTIAFLHLSVASAFNHCNIDCRRTYAFHPRSAPSATRTSTPTTVSSKNNNINKNNNQNLHLYSNNKRQYDSSYLKLYSQLTTDQEEEVENDKIAPNTAILPFQSRGKVNEIDFCMSPSDVSLSRSYISTNDSNNNGDNDNDDDDTTNDSTTATTTSTTSTTMTTTTQPTIDENAGTMPSRTLSLTRALNNASNRAVRRILLSRSWPSAEALNMSLRQVLASQSSSSSSSDTNDNGDSSTTTSSTTSSTSTSDKNDPKCPVPRPVLNIIMRRSGEDNGVDGDVPTDIASTTTATTTTTTKTSSLGDIVTSPASSSSYSSPLRNINTNKQKQKQQQQGQGRKKRTEQEWVSDQMTAFRESYGQLGGYEYADAYLECILSLATSGVESTRVSEVLAGGVYDDSYRRVLAVLRSVGAVFEAFEEDTDSDDDATATASDTANSTATATATVTATAGVTAKKGSSPRMKITSRLIDADICLSMLDKISIRDGKTLSFQESKVEEEESEVSNVSNITADESISDQSEDEQDEIDEDDAVEVVELKLEAKNETTSIDDVKDLDNKNGLGSLFSWFKPKKIEYDNDKQPIDDDDDDVEDDIVSEDIEEINDEKEEEIEEENEVSIKPEDLGGVLLSAEEPTVTRQLNVLSNIVKRALLFGGDQELLVLSETLEADKPAFIQRWYPNTGGDLYSDNLKQETRPGVQYFNCLVQLLKDCYSYGIVTVLDSPLPLTQSYANSYERLTAILVELGSGYIKPVNTKKILSTLPKTPTEEFQRFSQWEVALRKTKPDIATYPTDLIGTWQVRDEIGGKIIGTSTVVFKPEGEVFVDPPVQGLRWRLDPGPTHLDTCTFQVLNEDGCVLQYQGFMDRGARLESRFSKRSIKIRGVVTFQMRDGDATLMGEDYKRDMLPIQSQTGTTRFVMTKVFDLTD